MTPQSFWISYKACVLYCFTKRRHLNNYEKCFLFHLKSSFRSKDIQLFVFFPSFSTFSRFRGLDETGLIVMSRIGLHKLATGIFGITEKPLCV